MSDAYEGFKLESLVMGRTIETAIWKDAIGDIVIKQYPEGKENMIFIPREKIPVLVAALKREMEEST